VQDGSVEISDVNRLIGCAKADFIGRAVNDSFSHAGTCEPGAEGPRVVFASFCVSGVIERSSPEFRRPDDERFFEQTGMF
jgi:hypothetical protein